MVPAPTASSVRAPAMSVGLTSSATPPETERESEYHASRRAGAARPQPVGQRYPERHHRDQQGADPGRHALQRPTDQSVAAARHQ